MEPTPCICECGNTSDWIAVAGFIFSLVVGYFSIATYRYVVLDRSERCKIELTIGSMEWPVYDLGLKAKPLLFPALVVKLINVGRIPLNIKRVSFRSKLTNERADLLFPKQRAKNKSGGLMGGDFMLDTLTSAESKLVIDNIKDKLGVDKGKEVPVYVEVLLESGKVIHSKSLKV